MSDSPGFPDSAARDRDEAESASAFAHPSVAPDATAAYGDHPDQVVDFYAPRDGRTGAPLVVFLHGGAWRSRYDRVHASPLADFLARRGFAVANVEYRRGGDDIPPLRGVVALAPIADFATAVRLGVCGGAVTQLLGGEAGLADRAAHADPGALLPTGIATAIVQGVDDIVVPQAVSEAYVDAAAHAGETVGLTLLGGVGHFPLIDPAADACAVVAEEITQLAW